ncbi:zinc finger protein ZFP2-like [Anthonomus grandis grandis]|uniref:zinc finger protein ZFP2-like n=1 Tax=Anthonomus grandis grandis TaxID=2921223 RepID=UPI00216624FF|nr:zinc finger protein ZFP2-like [Anthonomus grandis grandis]
MNNNDFHKICRLCLQENPTLINIFFSEAAEIIAAVTNIKPKEGDFLPENICIPCMDRTSEFYTFKQECEKNHTFLKTLINVDNKTSPKVIEEDNAAVEELLATLDNSYSVQKPNQITIKNRTGQRIEIRRNLSELIPLEKYEEGAFQLKDELPKESCDKVHIENIQRSEVVEYKEIGINIPPNEMVDEQQETALKDPPHMCEYCSKNFINIELHIEKCHPEGGLHYCHICMQISKKAKYTSYDTVKKLQAHLKYHSNFPKHQCPECNKSFRTNHQKLLHMTSHSTKRPAACHLCQKTFKHHTYLAVHLKSHSGEKPYRCDVCAKGFLHKFTLKVHMKSHAKEREHMCPLCAKTFKHGFNLTIHLRQHTGEKPYTCQLCFNSFRSSSILKSHMLIHSDSKRFQCEMCEKKFKRTGDLHVHMRSHTGLKPYACAVCGNRYKMSSHLTEHMKTHSGEKNYICEICSKQFYNNRSLQIHKKAHSGNKDFACDICGKLFVHYTSLCAHIKRHKVSTVDEAVKPVHEEVFFVINLKTIR